MREQVLLLAAVLALAGCDGDSTARQITVHGVYAASVGGGTVQGMTLRVVETGEEVVTAADGRFQLRFPESLLDVTILIGREKTIVFAYTVPQERDEYDLTIGVDARTGAVFYMDYTTVR